MPEVSPAKRSRIIREAHASPDRKWTGSIGGRRVEIKIEAVPAVSVYWRVCISRRWYEGVAGNVWDALTAIEGPFDSSLKGRVACITPAPLFADGRV